MSDATAGDATDAAYLIVLRHVVVAQDIAQTIADVAPGARVLMAASAEEAGAALDVVPRLAVAFVGEGPRAYRGSALERSVAARGGRVVLMGGEAEAEGRAAGFEVLARPFSTAAIIALLEAGAGADPPRP